MNKKYTIKPLAWILDGNIIYAKTAFGEVIINEALVGGEYFLSGEESVFDRMQKYKTIDEAKEAANEMLKTALINHLEPDYKELCKFCAGTGVTWGHKVCYECKLLVTD